MTPGARRAINATLREMYGLAFDACMRADHKISIGATDDWRTHWRPCRKCKAAFKEMRVWLEHELVLDERRRTPRGTYRGGKRR